MKPTTFVGKDVADAVAQIRSQLGPEAVVLSVRQLAPQGVAKLWQRPRIEVQACLPDPGESPVRPLFTPVLDAALQASAAPAPEPARPEPLEQAPSLRPSVSARQALQRYHVQTSTLADPAPASIPLSDSDSATDLRSPWKSAMVLQRIGLQPLHVHRVLERMQELNGNGAPPPESLPRELALARAALLSFWRPPPQPSEEEPGVWHVFVGPPGTGKSTALCKWMAQSVLMDGQKAQVWRLDERTANTSEMVSLYGEILGVPVHRQWNPPVGPAGPDTRWVDLPGIEGQETSSMSGACRLLQQFRPARVHLVLNAAYTTSLLLSQVRAFSRLPVSDLILTHLDEETAWGKLWNLVVGTNYSLRFLSAGQNVPGRFSPATPEQLSPSLFPAKSAG